MPKLIARLTATYFSAGPREQRSSKWACRHHLGTMVPMQPTSGAEAPRCHKVLSSGGARRAKHAKKAHQAGSVPVGNKWQATNVLPDTQHVSRFSIVRREGCIRGPGLITGQPCAPPLIVDKTSNRGPTLEEGCTWAAACNAASGPHLRPP